MVDSILTNTKESLGIPVGDTTFDNDIITYINSAFSTLCQLGIGPLEGVTIAGSTATWSSLNLPMPWTNMIRTYILLKARMMHDPPITSFAIAAMEKVIQEQEFRLNIYREEALNA